MARRLSIETGRLAKQASGAVVVRVGDTMTLVATMAAPGREGLDFFPLTVDYREKVYAAGKFPGGFIKREGRPTTKEILTSRLIDRPIRPLFPESYREEIQIQAGPISADRQNDADIPTMIGASATLLLAKVPFHGPIGGVRLARIDDKFVPLPTADELKKSDLDLVVASTAKAIVMIEGFAEEVPEPEMLEAIMAAHRFNQEIIALQHELLAAMGLPPYEAPVITVDPLRAVIYERYGSELREAKKIHGKADRNNAVKELKNRVIAELRRRRSRPASYTPAAVKSAFHGVEERVVRELILDGNRSDGRGPRDLRPISCEVGLLPRAHGSAIFQRGETQALVTTVLGTGADEQRVDGIMDEFSKKFMLDYNMPPFAVGEIRPIRGPGRREIGHGALAERSVAPILPDSSVVPVHDPGRLRHPRIERLELDGLGLWHDPQPDGRRCADQRSGRRHLDRPGAGRGQRPPCSPDRHHRRRGPLRRHGLQGRRHPARGDRHPARPQEPGDHRADRQGDARPGARGPPGDPPGDAPGDQAAPRGDLGERTRG